MNTINYNKMENKCYIIKPTFTENNEFIYDFSQLPPDVEKNGLFLNFPLKDVKVMKKCFHCGIEKETSEFGHNKRFKTGIDSRCKQCRKNDNANWYKNNTQK